jgi:chromosome segregation ATPase
MLNTLFNSTKKKVVAVTATGFILLGATNAFGAVSFQSLTDFIQGIFNSEKTEMTSQHATEKTADISELETFLTNLKSEIQTLLNTHNETEKTRVTDEVNGYQTQLQQQAETQADSDVEAKKTELTNTANTKIQESKDALDAKYNELFPATTTP